jgi:hypothetical protein
MQRRIFGQNQPAQTSRTEQAYKHRLQDLNNYLPGNDTA